LKSLETLQKSDFRKAGELTSGVKSEDRNRREKTKTDDMG
jgi:hypothetical protein